MIDFNRRKQMFEFYDIPMRTEDVKKEDPPLIDGVRDRYYEMLNSPHKPDEVLIEDEFGRLRWVKHGSVDHMNNIGSSYRIRKQMQGGLQDVDERKPTSSTFLCCVIMSRSSESEDDMGESTSRQRARLLR